MNQEIVIKLLSFFCGAIAYSALFLVPEALWSSLQLTLAIAPQISRCQELLPNNSCMFVAWILILLMETPSAFIYFIVVVISVKLISRNSPIAPIVPIYVVVGWALTNMVRVKLGEYGENNVFIFLQTFYMSLLFAFCFILLGQIEKIWQKRS